MTNTIFAANACDPNCDWRGINLAAATYFGVATLMFLLTVVAVIHAWRTGKARAWVPLVASVGTIAGLWAGLTLYSAAVR